MSEYLSDKPKLLIVKDKDGNVKNVQHFEHNENGDPLYYKKIEKDTVVSELIYQYEYDNLGRRTRIKIEDVLKGTATIMEYTY